MWGVTVHNHRSFRSCVKTSKSVKLFASVGTHFLHYGLLFCDRRWCNKFGKSVQYSLIIVLHYIPMGETPNQHKAYYDICCGTWICLIRNQILPRAILDGQIFFWRACDLKGRHKPNPEHTAALTQACRLADVITLYRFIFFIGTQLKKCQICSKLCNGCGSPEGIIAW